MSSAKDLREQFSILDASIKDSNYKRAMFVGLPLDTFGGAFQKIFGYVIGFEWFLGFSYNLGLPHLDFNLPFMAHLAQKEWHYSDNWISEFKNDDKLCQINPINWWAIPFNFIACNVGSALGWLIVSPFTIPAYLGIKAYYGIKDLMLKLNIHNIFKKIRSAEEIVKGWILPLSDSNTRGLYRAHRKRIAEYVSARAMFEAVVEYHRGRLLSQHKGGRDPFACANYYRKSQKKVFKNQRAWSLAKTILSGILIVPLFFTISAYRELIREQEDELNLWQDKRDILEALRNANDSELCANILYYKQEVVLANLFYAEKGSNPIINDAGMNELKKDDTEKTSSPVLERSRIQNPAKGSSSFSFCFGFFQATAPNSDITHGKQPGI